MVGYSLRAWANRHVDASVLVLYNAVQPPITAALAVVTGAGAYGGREAGATVLVILAVVAATRGPCRRRPVALGVDECEEERLT